MKKIIFEILLFVMWFIIAISDFSTGHINIGILATICAACALLTSILTIINYRKKKKQEAVTENKQ